MTLYYAVARAAPDARLEDFAARFLAAFLRGYERENTLDPFWLDTLTTFLLVRDIVLYLKLQQKWEPRTRVLKPAQQNVLERLKDRIDTEVPRIRLADIV